MAVKIFVLLFFLIKASSVFAEEAFNGLVGFTAGYDDNASISSEQKKSAFASYRIKLDFHFFPKNPVSEVDIFAEGIYRQYFGLEDNFRLKTGGYFSWNMAEGYLMPGIFGDLLVYKDGLNRSDEKNGVTAGAKIDWLASARLTIGIQQAWSYQKYDNWQDIYAYKDNHDQMLQVNNNSHVPPKPPAFPEVKTDQNESLSFTGIRCVIYMSSELKGEVSGEYVKSDFSIYSESYIEKGAAFSLVWIMDNSWEIIPSIYLKYFNYNDTPDRKKRDDTERGIGININRFFKDLELFVRIDLTNHNSNLDSETYRRTVTQCGIAWSF